MNYENPKITITMFDEENIVTTSAKHMTAVESVTRKLMNDENHYEDVIVFK